MTIRDFKDFDEFVRFTRYVCDKHKWEKNWSKGGCYIHLEVSEFIEALRGKGDPVDELGDVLFTLIAVADYYDVDPVEALRGNVAKHKDRLKILEE
jgi:NTP pyrophosphatase (non-canonical NTP hydrolase)